MRRPDEGVRGIPVPLHSLGPKSTWLRTPWWDGHLVSELAFGGELTRMGRAGGGRLKKFGFLVFQRLGEM